MIKHDYIENSVVDGELLLFRTLWNNSDDNMFIVRLNADGEFISEASNRSLEQTFGLEMNQIDGLNLKDILDEATFETVSSRYEECIRLRKPITYDESVIIDGENERFWNTTILPVIDERNGTCKIFGISREVTKLHDAQKELSHLNKTLENKVQLRTEELSVALEHVRKLSQMDKLTGLLPTNNKH